MRIFGAAALPVIVLAASQCASGFQMLPSQMSRSTTPSATGVCRTGGAWIGGDLRSTSSFLTPNAKAALHSLRVARGRAATGPWMAGGGQDPPAPRAKRALQDLITQRAVQTHLFNLFNVRNEITANWLEGFQGHEHLKLSRISDYESQPKYHGIDGLRMSTEDYLGSMLNAEPHVVKVRYAVGTADGQGVAQTEEPDYSEYIKTFGEEPPWAAASRSRRNNPYLKKEQEYREFDETIVPKVVAEALMSVRSQIAAEMKLDIMMLPGESEKTLASYKLKEDRKGQWQGEGSNMFNMVGNGEWESTAFRFLNYDLLRKLSVRYALLDTLDELSEKKGQEGAALSSWFKGFVSSHLAVFEGPSAVGVGDEVIRELLGQPFSISTDQGSKDRKGSTTLIDPHQVCDRVIQRRGEIASEWATWLADEEVAGFHTNVIKQYLAGNLDRMWGERENEDIGAGKEDEEEEEEEVVSATGKQDDVGIGTVKQEKEGDEEEKEKKEEDVIAADEEKIEVNLVDGALEVGGVSSASSSEGKEASVCLQSHGSSLVSDVVDAAGKVGGGSQDGVDRAQKGESTGDAVMASNHGKNVGSGSRKKGKKGGNLRMPKKRGKSARSLKSKGNDKLA